MVAKREREKRKRRKQQHAPQSQVNERKRITTVLNTRAASEIQIISTFSCKFKHIIQIGSNSSEKRERERQRTCQERSWAVRSSEKQHAHQSAAEHAHGSAGAGLRAITFTRAHAKIMQSADKCERIFFPKSNIFFTENWNFLSANIFRARLPL